MRPWYPGRGSLPSSIFLPPESSLASHSFKTAPGSPIMQPIIHGADSLNPREAQVSREQESSDFPRCLSFTFPFPPLSIPAENMGRQSRNIPLLYAFRPINCVHLRSFRANRERTLRARRERKLRAIPESAAYVFFPQTEFHASWSSICALPNCDKKTE